MPVLLGGSGDFMKSLDNHPYRDHAPYLKEYLLIPMGYAVGGLIQLFFIKSRSDDFIAMGLHHVVTIYLFGGCYLYNNWEQGVTISFLHILADLTTNVAKILSETIYKKTAIFMFVIVHMTVWFYSRCIVLPYIIYQLYLIGEEKD